jgi:hypothetical protein
MSLFHAECIAFIFNASSGDRLHTLSTNLVYLKNKTIDPSNGAVTRAITGYLCIGFSWTLLVEHFTVSKYR